MPRGLFYAGEARKQQSASISNKGAAYFGIIFPSGNIDQPNGYPSAPPASAASIRDQAMTDLSKAVAVGEFDAAAADPSMFYVVSRRKLVVLYLLTLGFYGVYWHYQNWARYNRNSPNAARAGNGVWPLPRAVFSVFFVHDLLAKVKAQGSRINEVGIWDTKPHAILLVLLLLLSNVLDRAASKSVGSPYTDVLALLILFPLAHQYSMAQTMINLSCGDPKGKGNDRFGAANIAWMVVGGLLWLLLLLGLFLPD
jgi:hypothetical protein